MGEVQHSLFVSTHHFSTVSGLGPRRKTGREGIPFFSWQDILPFPRSTPIGDPLLYSSVVRDLVLEKEPQRLGPVIVMPKMNEEQCEQSRLRSYAELISFARSHFGNREMKLSLHPVDKTMEQALGFNEEPKNVVLGSEKLDPARVTIERILALKDASCVVSDYFGAHIFRASGLFQTPTLVSNSGLHDFLHPKMRSYFEAFQELAPDASERTELSRLILGTDYVRERDELRHLLFWPNTPSLVKRFYVSGYKTRRRLGVRARNSSLLGKSAVWGWWTHRYRRSRWKREFARSFGVPT